MNEGRRHNIETLSSFDGFLLPLRSWLPEGDSEAVVLAVHGFNDYSNFCANLAEPLGRSKVALYAYDQRGFGATEDAGRWHGQDKMVADLAFVSQIIRERHPDVPVTVFGESMGGAVVILAEAISATARGQGRVPAFQADRLILSAPAVWGKHQQPWYHQASLYWMRSLFPNVTLPCQFLRSLDVSDPDLLEQMRQDPLVRQDFRVDTLGHVVDLMDTAWNCASKVERPTLLLHGEQDEVIPSYAAKSFWSRMPDDSRHHFLLYPDGRHMLSRDRGCQDVIETVTEWTSTQKVSCSQAREPHRKPSHVHDDVHGFSFASGFGYPL